MSTEPMQRADPHASFHDGAATWDSGKDLQVTSYFVPFAIPGLPERPWHFGDFGLALWH
jgi:hypothetical protein